MGNASTRPVCSLHPFLNYFHVFRPLLTEHTHCTGTFIPFTDLGVMVILNTVCDSQYVSIQSMLFTDHQHTCHLTVTVTDELNIPHTSYRTKLVPRSFPRSFPPAALPRAWASFRLTQEGSWQVRWRHHPIGGC